MMRTARFVVAAWLIAVGAQAQPQVTVGVFSSTTTNPNATTPIATVAYGSGTSRAITCSAPRLAETSPMGVPQEGRFADPANGALDCFFDVTPSVLTLPVGTYRAAAKTTPPGTFGAVTTAFAIAQGTPHACDGTPPTTGVVVAGSRPFAWCWNGLDTNGNPTTITEWGLYVDGVRSISPTPTVGSTANAAGLKLYTVTLAVTAGTRTFQVEAVNSAGPGARSVLYTATITVPVVVPSAAIIRGFSF